MTCSHGRAVESDDSASFEDSVDDGAGEVVIVKDIAPFRQRLVGGEDHGFVPAMAFVDDVEQDVGCGIGAG